MPVRACAFAFVHVCGSLHVCASVHVCTSVCTCVCTCVCVCVCVCQVSTRDTELNDRLAQAESNMTALIDTAKAELKNSIQALEADLSRVREEASQGAASSAMQAEERVQSLAADLSVLREGLGKQTSEMAAILTQLADCEGSIQAQVG